MSHACDPADALSGLFHDAAEAYLVDLPRPIKHHTRLGEEYIRLECAIDREVRRRFGLPMELPPSVRHADDAVLMAEMRDLMAPPPRPWREQAIPWPERIVPMQPALARAAFLQRYAVLSGG